MKNNCSSIRRAVVSLSLNRECVRFRPNLITRKKQLPRSELQLKDNVIVVTGGAKGIGRASVLALASEGAVPVIVGRNKEDNLGVLEEVRMLGAEGFQVVAELTRPEECKNAVQIVLEQFGFIHGLINNAGVNDGVGLESGDYHQFLASLHRNLVHYYLMVHYALPALKKSGGAIVNITSKTAETGQGDRKSTRLNYSH